MFRLILSINILTLIVGCAPVITKEAAQVAFHSQISQLLDGCERLGAIKVEYQSSGKLSYKENELQAKNNMRQIAYDKYGADNVVFINSQRVSGGYGRGDTIYAQGVAFKCDK